MDSLYHRYSNDPEFRRLVDMMDAIIGEGNFSPSEIRQAAMAACINREMRTWRHRTIIPQDAETAIQTLESL